MTRADQFIDQYRQIHASRSYGRTSEYQLGFILRATEDKWGQIRSILDYGCGRSRTVDWLAHMLGAKAHRYDPAIPEFATLPVARADLVICTDVLEHVPEESLDQTLTAVSLLSNLAFFNIALTPANEILPNGENAHCTVKPAEWWGKKIADHFGTAVVMRSYSSQSISFITWLPPGVKPAPRTDVSARQEAKKSDLPQVEPAKPATTRKARKKPNDKPKPNRAKRSKTD